LPPPPSSTLFPTRRSSDLGHRPHLPGPDGIRLRPAARHLARQLRAARRSALDAPPHRALLPRHAPPHTRLTSPLLLFPLRRRTRSEEHTSELQSPYDLACR